MLKLNSLFLLHLPSIALYLLSSLSPSLPFCSHSPPPSLYILPLPPPSTFFSLGFHYLIKFSVSDLTVLWNGSFRLTFSGREKRPFLLLLLLLVAFLFPGKFRSLSSDSSFQNYSTPFVVNIRMLDFVVKEEGKEEEEEACNENSWGWGIDVDEIWFEKKRRSKVYCWIRFRNIVSSFKNIPIKYKWHKRCRNSWKYYKTACEEYFSEIAEFELRFDVVKKKKHFYLGSSNQRNGRKSNHEKE